MKKRILILLMAFTMLTPTAAVYAAGNEEAVVSEDKVLYGAANGLVGDRNGQYKLMLNGKWAKTYTGLYNDAKLGWWYVKNGLVDFSFNDLYCDSKVGWWKITNGRVDFSYNGVFNSPTYGAWNIVGGRVDLSSGKQSANSTNNNADNKTATTAAANQQTEVTVNTLNVKLHSREQIRNFIKNRPFETKNAGYASTPSIKLPYSLGKPSSKELENGINALNTMRYIAGIGADVTLDEDYTRKAQAACVVNAANGDMTHNISKCPEGMESWMYELAKAGASSSNLGWGYSSLAESVIRGWMQDDDSSNIAMLGHRRWILNPKMGKTGMGEAANQTAMYAFDTSSSDAVVGVAWPAQNMPIDYMTSNTPWSYSYGKTVDFKTSSAIITNVTTGQKWVFTPSKSDGYFGVDNGGYGQTGCVIMRPNNVTYNDGDLYEVIISTNAGDVKYNVSFFKL